MMQCKRWTSTMAVSLACLGILIPHNVLADKLPSPTLSETPVVPDVTLTEDGNLVGQMVDTSGQPVSEHNIAIRSGKQIVATVTTDEQGFFTVHELRGGVYQITTGHGSSAVRAWSSGTAPPVAKNRLLVIDGVHTVRGLGENLANPWILAAIAAAAITIPLALDDDGNAS